MTGAKRYTLHMRITKKFKENLDSAARMAEIPSSALVERAVDAYITEHWHDLQPAPVKFEDK